MRLRSSVLAASVLGFSTSAFASVPAGFAETAYSSNALSPVTGAAWAPDGSGRLFVLNKDGAVRVAHLQDGELATANGQLVLETFATEVVHTNSENGLLGITFDPNFLRNRWVYFFVSASASELRIVRYTDADGVGGERTEIVRNLPSAGTTRVGGGLSFGADGKLYFGIGDLGNGTGVDADLTSVASKISRCESDGRPANDNPFNDGVGPNNEYIWARGVRNPFGLALQPETGRLWANVAGSGYEQVFLVGSRSHAGFNDYENDQPANGDYITPAIAYRTNSIDTRTLSSVARAAGVLTATTPAAHRFRVGQRVVLAGVTDASFNGPVYVASTPSATAFTAAQVGADAITGGGTVSSTDLGGAITRGAFYDSTAFPPEYRGNYFFGDYNSANIVRASLAGTAVRAVDVWGTQFASNVQVTTGEDGALYMLGYTGGRVRRVQAIPTAQKLIVTGLHPYVPEGGEASFTVALSEAPAAPLTVTVSRSGGDADLSVSEGNSSPFTPDDWRRPRRVTLYAALDADTEVDTAEFSVSAPGLASETVHARSIEQKGPALVLSESALTVDEGSESSVTVRWSARLPVGTTVSVRRLAGDTDLTALEPVLLTFTPANSEVPQTVTFAAAPDADGLHGRARFVFASPSFSEVLDVIERDAEPEPELDAGADAGPIGEAGVEDAGASSGAPGASSGAPGASSGAPGASSGASSSASGAPSASSSSGEPPIAGNDDEDLSGGGCGCSTHSNTAGNALVAALACAVWVRRNRRRTR